MNRPTAFVALMAIVLAACAAPASDVQGGAEPVETSSVTSGDDSQDNGAAQDEQTAAGYQAGNAAQQPPSTASDEIPAQGVEPTEEEGDDVDLPPSDEGNGAEPIVEEEPAYPGPVAFAIADLSNRLGIDDSTITLVSFQAKIWPDGGLGCPQPGVAYMQVPVDGALIVLSVDGREFRYHSGGARDPFLCLTD